VNVDGTGNRVASMIFGSWEGGSAFKRGYLVRWEEDKR